MHELSIVMSIIEIAEKELRQHEGKAIEEIELDIGKISGIEIPALEFAFQHATKNTCLENAEHKINIIPASAICSDCGENSFPESLYDPCNKCGGYLLHFLSGREMKVKSISII